MFIVVVIAIFISIFIESALYLLQQKKLLTKFFGKRAFALHVLTISVVWLITITLFILLQFEKHPNFHDITILRYIGLILIPTGLILSFWAALLLGWRRMFSIRLFVKKQPAVVRHSLYKYFKHPFYYGLVLTLTGFTLYSASLYNLIILIEIIILLIPHIAIEEKGLKR